MAVETRIEPETNEPVGATTHPHSVRVVTLNLWGEQPPFEERMVLCQRELLALHPDVVALQEVREVPGKVPNQATTIGAALGHHVLFAPTVEWGGGVEGLGILSRYPFAASGHVELPHATPTERRICLWGTMETHCGKLAVFCTHLNYRMTHGVHREDQIEAVDQLIERTCSEHRPHVSILMGDLNSTPDSDEIRYLRGLHSIKGRRTYYQDAFLRRHTSNPGYTWSRLNPYTQRLRWLETDRRIDYVFVSPMSRDGRGLIHDARIVLDVPDGTGTYPSDHFGVFAEVQLAPLEDTTSPS